MLFRSRGRALPACGHGQPPAGVPEKGPHERRQQKRDINQSVLLKKNRTENGDVAEQGQRELIETGGGAADVGRTEKPGQARAEDGQSQARDDLVAVTGRNGKRT